MVEILEEEKTYGCDYVARVIGATPQTVRNYTRDYDAFLTSTRGENGQRSYTKKDMAVLKKIHDLRKKEHMGSAEIRQYLTGSAVSTETQMIASAVSVELHDKIKAFFDIGMQGISKQVGRLSAHMDTMEGAVKKQREEMKRLYEQNEVLRQQVEENEKIVRLLAKDMDKSSKEQLEAIGKARGDVQNLAKENAVKKIEDKIGQMVKSRKEDHKALLNTIKEAISNASAREDAEIAKQEKEQYKRARNALTKLAAEVDKKNAQIAELLKEKEELQKNRRFGLSKKRKSTDIVLLNETEPRVEVKTLDGDTNYVDSLKTVAQSPKAEKHFSLPARLIRQHA